MKRYIICFFLCVLCNITAVSQTITDVFMSMPESMMPALSSVNRADLIDFRKSGMKAVVTNALDYKVEMIHYTDSYVSVNTSSVGNIQLKLLPLNDSIKVVCVVRTVCPEACMSNVRFFSTEWDELRPEAFFSVPDIKYFMKNTDIESLDSIRHSSLSDIMMFRYDLYGEENRMSVSLTIDKYVTDEENAFLDRLIGDKTQVMVWRNGRFEIE